MGNRDEMFGRLLRAGIGSIATYEGKTAPVVEDELGLQLGVAGKTVQRYKTGYIPPERERVRILAEACVTRGLMGRPWLARFLQAARYLEARTLVDQLCPTEPELASPMYPTSNLPAASYSRFILRTQILAELAAALQSRSATVVIVGLGGMGKTSLAREAAVRSLAGEQPFPQAVAVIWVSDAQRPGTTNLDLVLDTIARVLDYPGLTELAHAEKRAGVERLLRGTRALLVVDNAETITDGALLSWLLHLPEPSKAIITTRSYLHIYRQGGWMLELRGMQEEEALELAHVRIHQLGLPTPVDPSRILPLLHAAGGNPKAITIALGLVKYEHRTIPEVVDDLREARGEPFDELFAHAWALLDDAARRALRAMALLPAGASLESLAAVADIPAQAIRRAVERLVDLALVDVEQRDLGLAPRYVAHPLVRAFAGARLTNQGDEFLSARHRRISFFAAFVRQSDPDKWNYTEEFDAVEQEIATIEEVLQDCDRLNDHAHLVAIMLTLGHFWHVRGYWQLRDTYVPLAVAAAQAIDDQEAEVQLRCADVRILIDQDRLEQAEHQFTITQALYQTISTPTAGITNRIAVDQIALFTAQGRHAEALLAAENLVAISEREQFRWAVVNQYYVPTALFHLGRFAEARAQLERLISQSDQAEFLRAAITGWSVLAQIAIHDRNFSVAEDALRRAEERSAQLHHQRNLAKLQRIWSEYYRVRGDIGAARTALTDAAERFTRLGMRRHLREAEVALASLDHDCAVPMPLDI